MTGRLHLVAEEIELIKFFGVTELLPGLHKMPPRHNVAPGTPVLTITHEYGARTARLMKWTFVPDWVKDPRDFTQISTARMETVEKKPSFKNAVKYRRCLVPVTGFYEWQRPKEGCEGGLTFSGEPMGVCLCWRAYGKPGWVQMARNLTGSHC